MPRIPALMLVFTATASAFAQTTPTQLTIYNDNFAIVRTEVPLDLHPGTNHIRTTDVTGQLEPDSVILRDSTGKRPALHILEQNYDAGVVTQASLLQHYEGQTLEFQKDSGSKVTARLIRAGDQPLVEVDGHLQFQLPGLPLFPETSGDLLLKPTLDWQIESHDAARFPAELDYMTGGFSWHAAYNVVLPESAALTETETGEIIGWVTIQNESGTAFPSATIQLMAGDVSKIHELQHQIRAFNLNGQNAGSGSIRPAVVTQKAFDDFHLYDLHRTLALGNHETKQVQFLQTPGITVRRAYEYSGNDPRMQPLYSGFHDIQRGASQSNGRASVEQEIRNTTDNHLGMPLPAGRLRLYRRESTGQLQFVGESNVPHTAADQPLHIVSGRAFDITGERKQTDFHVDNDGHNMDESFEITLSNAKDQPVLVHSVEHMNRAENWQITEKSMDFTKRDSSTIDFPITVPSKGQATITYKVHYTW